ncbi:hybrid sensor histidine kinase/response regulator [Maliponia aquimaris]|uniref:histidine kinase n=1 Tax=Maliponia aquimaris TaxID=1673631 RepID=A0A238L412_9RHOB|nr:ATP-binding protein [Maliponia aquimaris]SMX49152.1 Aerobic respiration control sensor protein ArcB [Maliponia aquimaris]
MRNWLAGVTIVLILIAIAVLVLDLRRQTERLSASAADNMQWTLGQAEVELMALEIAAIRVLDGLDPLSEVRLRYDIFYSRIETLVASHRFEVLINVGDLQQRIDEIVRFRTRWLPLIDGPDEELLAGLPLLVSESEALRVAVRDFVLVGITHFSEVSFEQRDSLGKSMVRIGLLTVALIAMLAVLAFALFRLARKSDAEATANRETRERIETILSTALDAVIVSDDAGLIVEYNGAAERLFGYSRAEAIGADMADLIIPDHYREAHRRGMKHFHADRAPRVIGKGAVRLDARRRDGSVFPVDVSLANAQSPAGEIFIAFIRDISDRVRNEAALKRARDRAIAGEKQKTDLLAVMSHEMRTPLNGMLGTLELFDEGRLDPRHQRYLRIVRNSGKVLLGHVNDVLDISRLDAGKMSLRKVRFDLVSLLEEIVDNQAPRASARGNTLELTPPNPGLHEVYSDPDRLRQILLNLVSNAIKFTWNGRITIEADRADGSDEVEIRITDTGIGISEADLDRIFDDFVTIDSSYARSTSGTGLGLGISQRLAAALGGELGAESEPGDGSVFWLRLPMAPPPALKTAQPDDMPVAEVRPVSGPPPVAILLVEDNEINRIVARELLERDGHSVEAATDGTSALRKAESRRFDVILLDISMPGVDGLRVAQELRGGNGPNALTPIVATTAHALPHEVQAFYEAGMQNVLIKPLNTEAIRRALAEALSGEDVQAPLSSTGLSMLIDEAHLAEMRRELAPARFEQVHTTFAAEMHEFLNAMPGLISDGEDGLAALASEAHRMAGSAGVMGAMRLTNLLREVHADTQDGDAVALRCKLDRLRACWTATAKALTRLCAPPSPTI